MKAFCFTTLAVLCMIFTFQVDAVEERSLALTLTQINDQDAWGGIFETPFATGEVSGHFTTTFQGGSGIIRGKYHAEGGITRGGFDFILYTDGIYKGPTVRDLGRQADLGLAIEFPDQYKNKLKFTGGVGIFGRNAGPFGPRDAYGDLEGLGYDPNALDGRGLESLRPPPKGLSFKAGNSLNALFYTEATHPNGFGLTVKLMPELAGAGDNPVHQMIVTPYASFELSDKLNLDVSADFGIQGFEGEIQTEAAALAAVKYEF